MFESLTALPPDAILKLIGEHQNDARENKVDLGVGVYRDEHGQTPILAAVKKAERYILDHQQTKAYTGSAGDPVFNETMQDLIFGDHSSASGRITTLQSPGGSGSLRVAAGLILRAKADVSLWVSDPTWNNHVPLLGGAGVQLETYPYYDADKKCLRIDALLETLSTIPSGDIVLFHGCCHNPTGIDPSSEQWRQIADIVVERGLLPFIDIAYQGLANGIDEDVQAIRQLAERVPEMLVSSSCSKNFGLYRDRVGALSIVSSDADVSQIVYSQASQIVRTIYSVPPDHGAAVVSHILRDPDLRAQWAAELGEMRERLKSVRSMLVEALQETAPAHDFSHIGSANGMFSYLGISPQQVTRLKTDFGIYMEGFGRINVAGITAKNVGYLAESIARVL
ncbi:MAG: aspartate/tyrosine/aromatic aminotransferase [Gammaproteobacteria bacterium]|nr:aspartate/tyrosine/aromatic aminotransferase [Gammaproteobacteria bacterium]